MGPLAQEQGRSLLDMHRESAAVMFGPRLEALKQTAADRAANQQRYLAACRGKVTRATGTGTVVSATDFSLQEFVSITLNTNNETTPECRVLASDIVRQSSDLERELQQMDEDARRRGIFPGVMRDLRARHGFRR